MKLVVLFSLFSLLAANVHAHEQGTWIVRAGLANVDDLSREMVKLSSRRIPVTIFDMSQLVFACSLAIGTFIQYQQGARNHDGVVHFCGFNETLSKALNKANLHLVLNIYDNVDDALASV